jgi:hypothetical protein
VAQADQVAVQLPQFPTAEPIHLPFDRKESHEWKISNDPASVKTLRGEHQAFHGCERFEIRSGLLCGAEFRLEQVYVTFGTFSDFRQSPSLRPRCKARVKSVRRRLATCAGSGRV